MRLLVVDVGNTSTAVGLWTDGRVSGVVRCDGGGVAARVAAARIVSKGRPSAVAYLSVVPGEDRAWRRFARTAGLPFAAADWRACPFKIDYSRPETIGADRLADAAAAIVRHGVPVIVCDFGTAFTAAAITSDRVWRGGAIAPGFPLMSDYLHERTAKLPRVKLGGRCPRSGRSTEEAMRFGAMVGYRGMVREIVGELSSNFKTRFGLVATGGFAKWALRGIGMDFTIDPVLTLAGAGMLAKELLDKGGGE